ncbi:hypothetical protein RB653_007590 [Dictyostelium firmibasis]|uniref:FAD dependent oxidoreductase domain-containing protein n=1 Tax=Dictyostelium firmibasis TaxID=79012 RepID=A0AAN7TUT8_9MYCE
MSNYNYNGGIKNLIDTNNINNNLNQSYWEKKSLSRYDYIVIGSGIVGLSTAISIKERSPQSSVLILERDTHPNGASTKNAGFACVGSLTEIMDDLKTMNEQEVLDLVSARYRGLQLLRKRLGDENIGYKDNGSFELIDSNSNLSNQSILLENIERVNQLLRKVLPGDAFTLCTNDQMKSFGFSDKICSYLIKNNFEGEIDTGKMMFQYTELALSWNVHIKNGSRVLKFIDGNENDSSQLVKVLVENPFSLSNSTLTKPMEFTCKKLAICTNAFTGDLVENIDITPGRGQVLITDPIPGLQLKGIYHFDEGYYYFREKDGCILFGGGRNLDFKTEATTEFKLNPMILNKLYQLLQDHIIPNTKFTVNTVWCGIMAFGKDKKPIIQFNDGSKNVVLGVRMGGMGVAIGSLVGRMLADMILSTDANSSLNNQNTINNLISKL